MLAALGLAHPPLLASLMDECLEGVERSGQQLSLLAAPYANKPAAASRTAGSTGEGRTACTCCCRNQVLPFVFCDPSLSTATGMPRAATDSQTGELP